MNQPFVRPVDRGLPGIKRNANSPVLQIPSLTCVDRTLPSSRLRMRFRFRPISLHLLPRTRFNSHKSIHASAPLNWRQRDEYRLPKSEIVDRISRLLILQRFDAIHKLTFTFSDDLVDAVLFKLRLNPSACSTFFELACKENHYRPNMRCCCRMVHILAKGRRFDESRDLLRKLIGLGKCGEEFVGVWDEVVCVFKEFKFAPVVFDMMLKVCVEKGMVKSALHVFDNMGKCGGKPSLRSCNGLLSCLVRNGMCREVGSMFEQMRGIGIVPDVFMVSIVVNAYCKVENVGRAVEFVKEMESMGFEANQVTFHSLMNGYVSQGDVVAANGVLEMMLEKGIARNLVSYTLLIKGYCKVSNMCEAERVMRGIKEDESLIVDEYVYGVLIDGYCRVGNMNDAVRLRDEMVKSGLKMNVLICNSIINGYCKLGQICEAEAALMQMGDGLKPDSYSFNTILDGYCREGHIHKGFKLCEKMLREGLKPTVVSYNTLIKGLCGTGALNDALRLWKLMLKRDLVPNEISYCTLLGGFFETGDADGALKLWKEILAKGFSQSSVAYNIMISGLSKLGRTVEAEEIINRMKDLNCMPDAVTHKALSVGGYCRVGKTNQAVKVEAMMSSG